MGSSQYLFLSFILSGTLAINIGGVIIGLGMAGGLPITGLLGGVTGSMTSGAALGYTGAYAFANVILTIAGTLIMLL